MLSCSCDGLGLNAYGEETKLPWRQGVNAIISALQVNTTIEILSLSNNNLEDEDTAKLLGSILKSNQTLRALELFNCKFSSPGIEALSAGLICNRSLDRLEITTYTLKPEAIINIENALIRTPAPIRICSVFYNGSVLLRRKKVLLLVLLIGINARESFIPLSLLPAEIIRTVVSLISLL